MPTERPHGRSAHRHGSTRPAPTTTADCTICGRSHDNGEGAISTVLAVLIMALLGVAMWLMFENIWSDTTRDTQNPAETIDSNDKSEATG